MHPRAIFAFVLPRRFVRPRPIAFAFHHNPATASESPAGGLSAVSDWRKSSGVMMDTRALLSFSKHIIDLPHDSLGPRNLAPESFGMTRCACSQQKSGRF
jgi:hypothetical protein